jgi:putative transposase
MPPDLLAVIEGLALRRPASTIAAVHRQAAEVPGRQGWPAPSYGTVYAVVRGLDPGAGHARPPA